MRVVLTVGLTAWAGCGADPCPAGLTPAGPWSTCCHEGQSGGLLGGCRGVPTACPAGWSLEDAACTRDDLPPFRLVRVEPGSFTMGCLPERDGPDRPCMDNAPFDVTLTRPVYVMAHEVQQGLYAALMGTNPSRLPTSPEHPVDSVSWLDAVRFANALSAWEGLVPAYAIDGTTVRWDREAPGYRLLTEAEWEHAARAGDEAPFAGGFEADRVAVSERTQRGGPSAVGSLAPNPWGLYDLSGNLWEWTWSGWWTFPTDPATDPEGADEAEQRVVKGGGWSGMPDGLYLSSRGFIPAEFSDVILGFRVGRTAREDGPAVVEPAGAWTPAGP
ncbi:MAG: formylglycine-generating enzyme family protein [Alphaproteobacteria bacterium]|nr:formylglycine-generating enzyme family protein [Alphaproteobacteria bacterium]